MCIRDRPVCLTAASVDAEQTQLNLTIETADAQQSTISYKLSSEHTPLLVHLPCTPNVKQRIRLEVDRRSYVDSIAIYDGRYEQSDISRTDSEGAEASVVYHDLQETSLTLRELGAKDYRYRVRAVGGDFFSPWTDYQSVTLPTAESAVRGVMLTADDEAVYYDISGKRLETLPTLPGVYLQHRGGKVTKVITTSDTSK